MNNSNLVSYTKLSPFNSGKRTHSIDRITPHCVVGQCAIETLGTLFSQSGRNASSNYGIGADGRIGMFVEEDSVSWCSGGTLLKETIPNDQRAVTIECASDLTSPWAFKPIVYEKLIELCIDICKRNGKTKLLWIPDRTTALAYQPKSDEMLLTVHRWFANKACPGDWLMERMDDLAEKVTSALSSKIKLYDVTNYRAQYIKPNTNLTTWASENKPVALCNASLYSGISTTSRPTGSPVGTIFEDGALVHDDGNGFGFGIEDNHIVFGKPWERTWKYYLTGYNCPVQNGQYVKPSFTDKYVFDNKLNRIGIGQTKDNKTVIVCDDNVTLQQFAEHAIQNNITTLVNLDGGASRHLVYNNEAIYTSTRVPYNAIAFFEEKPKETNETSTRKYIDISIYQGQIDWDKVKAEGNVSGVMIRAGSGKNHIDTQFIYNATECNRVGIPCGAYWFSYATTDKEAQAEANYLLAAVKPFRMELPLAYDFEYDSVNNAKNNGITITKEMASSLVRAFCDTIEKAGYWVLNYANPDYLSRYFDQSTTSRYGLWLAQWPNVVDVTKPPRQCDIWQWGTSTIPGIKTVVDTNEAYKDFATLIKQYGMNNLKAEQENPKPDEPWYAEAMKFVSERGWMQDERPKDPLTRAELATVLMRMFKE